MRHTHYFNGLKTALLLGVLSAVLIVVGGAVDGETGLVIALVIALGMNGYAYFYSDKRALASMQAYPVSEVEQPRLYAIVRELAQRDNIPMPRIYLSPTDAPNAFATGRNPRHAAVCATHGILGILDDREMRGVLGHELSHVYNRDILISSVAAALAAAITFLASIARFGAFFGIGGSRDDDGDNVLVLLLFGLFGGLGAAIVQLAISRSREYQADASGARVTGDPLALASALRKLEYGAAARPLPNQPAIATTSSMMIVNPFRGGTVTRLFSTHPPMAERIDRLEKMAGQRLQ